MRTYILRLRGKAKGVFAMLALLAVTRPIEQDRGLWELRACLMANDKDKQPTLPIRMRSN